MDAIQIPKSHPLQFSWPFYLSLIQYNSFNELPFWFLYVYTSFSFSNHISVHCWSTSISFWSSQESASDFITFHTFVSSANNFILLYKTAHWHRLETRVALTHSLAALHWLPYCNPNDPQRSFSYLCCWWSYKAIIYSIPPQFMDQSVVRDSVECFLVI